MKLAFTIHWYGGISADIPTTHETYIADIPNDILPAEVRGQLAATRHHKFKRCLAKKEECKIRSVRYQDLWEKWRKTESDTSGSYYRNYIKWWHRAMKWKSLAEKFKEDE